MAQRLFNRSQVNAVVETIHNESARREGAPEISRSGAENDWARCDSAPELGAGAAVRKMDRFVS